MGTIKMICECCEKTHELRRTSEIPDNIWVMRCNFCPGCEDEMDDYYNEWWDENENGEPEPIPVPDNQLCLPFIFDEIGIEQLQTITQ